MRICAILAMGLAVAGCGDAFEPLSAEEKLARSVERFNRNGGDVVADALPGSSTKARIDGGVTLVLMVSNVPSGTRTFDPNAVRKAMRPSLCSDDDFRAMIDQGIKVRFEMTSNFGKELPAVQFSRC